MASYIDRHSSSAIRPGGYVSAIRCAQLRPENRLVEDADHARGTCRKRGLAFPSQALGWHARTEMLMKAEHKFAEMGLEGQNAGRSISRRASYRDKTSAKTRAAIEFLFKEKTGIDWIKGWGSIPAPRQVRSVKTSMDASKSSSPPGRACRR